MRPAGIICISLGIFLLGLTLLFLSQNIGTDSKVATITENINKISKDCLETHNGTFTLRFEHGDNNSVMYECTYR